MQKIGILNSSIAKVLADMGHTDQLVIGDCGLPVPQGTPKIDLALRLGEPKFIDVVREVAKYMIIQKIYVVWKRKRKIPSSGRHSTKYSRKIRWNGRSSTAMKR